MLSVLLALALSQGAASAAAVATPTAAAPADDGPVTMTAAEIRSYNANLDRAHPAYIRCERALETGSLVKKRISCRTNAEWRRVHDIGNQDARETMEGIMLHNSTKDTSG
ncbi:MAG TPA: hypothetical protein VM055_01850 [Novosphingobium sp.]|nr:hypothetical protein [Novosphingobium sp.]